MSSSSLFRLSGLAALVGGSIWAILAAEEIVALAIGGVQPESVTLMSTTVRIVLAIDLLAIILICLGLVGLYVRKAEQTGTLGLIGFLMAFAGTVMVFGIPWSEIFFAPWLADAAPTALDAEPPVITIVGFSLSILLFAGGWIWLGLTSLKHSVWPRGATILLIVGILLATGLLFAFDVAIGFGVFGAALAWIGYTVWSEAGTPA